jgi:hypothetical protein
MEPIEEIVPLVVTSRKPPGNTVLLLMTGYSLVYDLFFLLI